MSDDSNRSDAKGVCAKCGSTDLIRDGVVFDFDRVGIGRLHAGFLANPDAIFMKGKTFNPVRARICGHCGYIEMFVVDSKELFQEYVKARQGRS
jgi:hypothetical protein